jgi:hypothetical protein
MKKMLTLILLACSLLATAQQENKFYVRLDILGDSTGKYEIKFAKYNSTNITDVNYGEAIGISTLQKQKWNLQNPILKNDESDEYINELFFNSERNYYDFINTDSMFASVVKIIIKEKKTLKQMHIVIPINVKAKWTEIFLEKIKFMPDKYIDVLKHAGRFDKEDNTVKIVCSNKVKLKYVSTSSFKL